ncbi:hypothetical protein SAMN05421693_12123 [Ectothiorhodospira magna]|uniref:Uncharacterized protein n=1 Tax=Ectothiorhodospira magna TaxID=867345 RepID=A0A1H9ECK7_9GAMM|nr:hypothetical protein SAMN05421693_12123 [Ectothiorhodospira magna]
MGFANPGDVSPCRGSVEARWGALGQHERVATLLREGMVAGKELPAAAPPHNTGKRADLHNAGAAGDLLGSAALTSTSTPISTPPRVASIFSRFTVLGLSAYLKPQHVRYALNRLSRNDHRPHTPGPELSAEGNASARSLVRRLSVRRVAHLPVAGRQARRRLTVAWSGGISSVSWARPNSRVTRPPLLSRPGQPSTHVEFEPPVHAARFAG